MLTAPTAEETHLSSEQDDENRSIYEAYRDSAEIKRMKSVNLDRKLSTTARIPKRSTVIESPAGRSVQPTDGQAPSWSVPRSPEVAPRGSPNQPGPPVPASPGRDRQGSQSYGKTLRPGEKPPRPPPLGEPPSSRPGYGRTLTAVRVVDDQPADNIAPRDGPVEPILTARDEEGLTLADLPQAMEAEQARHEHRPPPRPAQGVLLSELSALEYVIVKHAAALTLASDSSPFRDVISMDELLELIEARKNTFWGKIFKGANDKKPVKKKGTCDLLPMTLIDQYY